MTRLPVSETVREQTPQPSERVARLLEHGWTSSCAGAVALSSFSIRRRTNEPESHFLNVYAGERHVQVYVSPTGRSVRVFVDGTEA